MPANTANATEALHGFAVNENQSAKLEGWLDFYKSINFLSEFGVEYYGWSK